MSVSEDDPREPVLVSACLLGCACRYDGRDSRDRVLEDELAEQGLRPVPFCPEERGGLGTPRPPAWIESRDASAVLAGEARVVDAGGDDVTAAFLAGARAALDACQQLGISRAFLKERSPSCGVTATHVGDAVTAGPGVTASLLGASGIHVQGVEGRRGSETGEKEASTPTGRPDRGAREVLPEGPTSAA